MRLKNKKQHSSFFAVLGLQILAVVAINALRGDSPVPAENQNMPGYTSVLARVAVGEKRLPDTMLTRQAERLRNRIQRLSMTAPTVAILAEALAERQKMLSRSVSVTLTPEDAGVFAPWTVNLNRYPLWIRGSFTMGSAAYMLDTERIRGHLEEHGIEELPRPVNTVITEIFTDEYDVTRVKTEGTAKSGYSFDLNEAVQVVTEGLQNGLTEHALAVAKAPGTIVNLTGNDLGPLEFMTEGRSNFAGSAGGRINNVRKGLNERVHNVLVPPDSVFSFNKTLGAVVQSKGWYEALGIFNGDQLKPVTGGGICQVATTTYRAMLGAGFPVLKRKPHSLFVTYYEKYGVGIDATIYPGQQDLTFKNDSGNWILIQAYSDGFEATVNMYGAKDERKVTMEGPYFAANAPADLLIDERPLRKNEIVWIQNITHEDGRVEKNTVVSRYKSIPKRVVLKYTVTQPVHAAAPEELSLAR